MEALRSGKYSQIIGALHHGGGYCCWGVACELAIQDGVPVIKESRYPHAWSYDGGTAFPPAKVVEWLGLAGGNIFIKHLASENDRGRPFSSIADIIEKGLIEPYEQEHRSMARRA